MAVSGCCAAADEGDDGGEVPRWWRLWWRGNGRGGVEAVGVMMLSGSMVGCGVGWRGDGDDDVGCGGGWPESGRNLARKDGRRRK
ncbi:hypothetical protein Tco_1132109 [Tanacetum coccineum]|uniref:Uncharacterized protein n=1 Tax=Tanacetum coccineum TaxID=301880 RepID=A0ABQ5JB30_9ASTR